MANSGFAHPHFRRIVGAMGRVRQRRHENTVKATNDELAHRVSSPWDRHAIVAILASVLIAYFPALGAGFTNWDDDRFFTQNPLFHGPIGRYVAAAFTSIQFQAYHPLHILSYLPDRIFWPEQPAGFHAMNLALYALALALGYSLLRRSLTPLPALAATLLVGLHPIAVESVAWIVGRKDVLAMLFMICTLWVEDREQRTRRSTVWACVFATLACLAKTSAVVLPIVLVAWLCFVRAIPIRAALRRALPFAIIALVFSLPVPLIWRANQMIGSSRPLPFALDVLGTFGVYVGRIFAPLDLSPVYPAMARWQVPAGLLVAAGILAIVGWWRKLPPAGRFALVAFAGALLPVMNITPLYFRFADRYALLALAALVWPLGKLLSQRTGRTVIAIVTPIAIAVELWTTMQLVPVWHDSLTLWQHATQAQPRAAYGFLKLGETLRAEKRFREAANSYVRAGEIEPTSVKGPAGLLRTVGEKAEAEGRIPPKTCEVWEAVMAQPGFDARRMEKLIATLDEKSDCRSCAEAMLWLALRMFPQSDSSLINFANKELDRNRPDTAMIYLSEIRDAKATGLAEVTKRVDEVAARKGGQLPAH